MDAKDKNIVKIMTAKTYYEMGQVEPLRYSIDSSKHFINKNKSVGEVRKKSYLNFFNSLTKLISLSENGDKSSVASVIDTVKKTGELTEKAWILEKLNDLK
jgi:hypothetical protein